MEDDEKLQLQNPYLGKNEFLYHLDISCTDELPRRFGDVKFVCVGGTSSRMQSFAEVIYDQLGKPENSEFKETPANGRRLKDIAASGRRYAMFKVGPVISVSHGIGGASLSIVLHEIFKLLHFAGCEGVKCFRIGTSGGLGLDPGTVVVTEKAYNGLLENNFTNVACGNEYRLESNADPVLAEEILECAKQNGIEATIGNTLSTNDFYEEQGRLDGAFCCFTAEDKKMFLRRAHDEFNIKNIEMESAIFNAFCRRAGLKCAVVCVVIVNRLIRDDVTSDRQELAEWEQAPQLLVAKFIKSNQR